MKRALTTLVAIATICYAGASCAQATKATKSDGHDHAGHEAGNADEQAMMAKWMEYSTPGKHHEMFKSMAGTWQVTMKIWMGGPGAPPTTSEGTAEFETILGGRYLKQSYKSEFMGQPFEGMGLEGYDNFRKQYTSLWMDNMSTAVGTMSGQCDDAAKACTYYGRGDDPMTGQMDKLIRAHMKWVGEKSTFEMHEALGNGEWNKTMEITYVRKK